MFEHLGPKLDSFGKGRQTAFRLYLALLIFAIFVFTVSVNAQNIFTGDKNDPSNSYLAAGIAVNQYNKTVVSKVSKLSLFDFVLNPSADQTAVKKIELKTYGLFDQSILSRVYLAHNGTQIALPKSIDEFGTVYFELSDYFVNKGDNSFSILLNNDGLFKVGDLIQMSILKSQSLVLEKDGHVFFPRQATELRGGTISVVEVGQIVMTDNLPTNILVVSSQPQSIADFTLRSVGETADLRQLAFYLQYPKGVNMDDVLFSLHSKGKQLSYAYVQSGGILTFDFKTPLAVAPDSPLQLNIVTGGLKNGDYLLALENINIGGYASGQPVQIKQAEYSQQIKALSTYPNINVLKSQTNFSDGWNTLYEFQLSAAADQYDLERIGFILKTLRLDVQELQLWVDNQPSQAEIDLTGENYVSFYWPEPMKISRKPVNVKLLAKVKINDQTAAMQIGLDSSAFSWYIDRQPYDGSFVSSFPKTANIINN